LRHHGYVELALFILEVMLLVSSYLTAILLGPGFVPKGWEPSTEELLSLDGNTKNHPLDVPLTLGDRLQLCGRCNSLKPPRAHHCSSCGRCVLWMDHHCPWTNTCIGHSNLQPFFLFVHYVPVACLHSLLIQSEVPASIAMMLFRHQHRRFWKNIRRVHTIISLVFWLAALVITLLVGSLAWDMHWSVSANTTMVEELIVDKAESRRYRLKQEAFVFPYDLGSSGNWELIMGKRWLTWFCPARAQCNGFWPPLKEGSHHFDLSMEQLAQKAYKLSASLTVPVTKAFNFGIRRCCCCGYYWFRLSCKLGCGVACSGPLCGDPYLVVQPGDRVLANHREAHWFFGRVDTAAEGTEGWFPRDCADADNIQKYQVPHEKQLQGEWRTSRGLRVKVSTVLVSVEHAPAIYVLKKEGGFTMLLGCNLEQCDGQTVRWSNGDEWHRQGDTENENHSSELKSEPKKDV